MCWGSALVVPRVVATHALNRIWRPPETWLHRLANQAGGLANQRAAQIDTAPISIPLILTAQTAIPPSAALTGGLCGFRSREDALRDVQIHIERLRAISKTPDGRDDITKDAKPKN